VPGRGRRPGLQRPPEVPPEAEERCPFCEGHEDETPPETLALGRANGAPDTPGWQVRVVPNLYPAFVDPARQPQATPPFQALAARGRHEVVVHSPGHAVSLAELDDGALEVVAAAWRARAGAAREAGFAYVHAWINEGRAAGASRAHSHSQLAWLPEPPPALDRASGSHGCALCELLAADVAARARVVLEQDGLVCVCPYAARGPYELLVAPLRCEPDGFASERLAAALSLTAGAIRRLHAVAGAVPLNAWLSSAPFAAEAAHLHWHLVVLPRLTVFAGLELGAGIYVNTLAPERAASELRRAT
jgi:UDPglucose--hexose-1-phosphate uridylyltransferase